MIVLPANAANHFYSKNTVVWNGFMLTSVVYSALSNLAMTCLKPIPVLRRALPSVAPLPFERVDSSSPSAVAVVSGSNTGIGFETSKALVERGYRVVMACRSEEKALAAIQAIETSVPNAPGKAVFEGPLDLSSMASVHEFSERIKSKYDKISLLINNAGRNTGGKSEKGFDLIFQTNYLGHFALTKNLIPNLLAADGEARVINLSSVMHHFCYSDQKPQDADYWKSYALFGKRQLAGESSYSVSKLAALLHTIELNRRYADTSLRSIAVSPGSVNSDIWRGKSAWLRNKLFPLFYLDNKQGSYTTVAAAVKKDLPKDVVYLQPYHQVTTDRAVVPPMEMLGVFVGYLAIRPRLPKDGSDGALTAQVLWETSESLLADAAAME